METIDRHRRHADALRAAVTGPSGVSRASLREAVLARAAGGAPASEPYDALARQIGGTGDPVTDAQVADVRAAEGSDKGAFEIVMAASVGAGLARWEAAIRAIEDAGDASA